MSRWDSLSPEEQRHLKSVHWRYRYPRLYEWTNAVADRGERYGYVAFDVWERLRPGPSDILVKREWSRGLQPTMWFEDYLAHWDDDLVAGCAHHLESSLGVRAAVHVDREVVELTAFLVPVWMLRRRARRWIRKYQVSHPSELT